VKAAFFGRTALNRDVSAGRPTAELPAFTTKAARMTEI